MFECMKLATRRRGIADDFPGAISSENCARDPSERSEIGHGVASRARMPERVRIGGVVVRSAKDDPTGTDGPGRAANSAERSEPEHCSACTTRVFECNGYI